MLVSDRPATPRRTPPPPTGLDVVLYTGQAYERWNPETIARTGIGGSETMAWEMAKRLRARGARVRVYADCQGLEGEFDGVEWLDFQRFRDPQKCDVLISSRIPEVVDLPWQARAKIAWVHDVHMGQGLTNRRALKFDRYFCLSEWHKEFFLSHYPYVHESQVLVTRNGIDTSLYDQKVARNPHRIIYSSSPDRGLEQAMRIMPAVRLAVPDAELHVFYGFQNWEQSPDPGQQALCRQIQALLKSYEAHGVVHHGRVSAHELAREQLSSGVWLYPTWFSETSCRTAMEAQLAGLATSASPRAALPETAASPLTRWLLEFESPDFLPRAAELTIAALRNTTPEARTKTHEQARLRFGLDTLADEWMTGFGEIIKAVERDVLPPYKAAVGS